VMSEVILPTQAPAASAQERRASVRQVCLQDALTRPLEAPHQICWGAVVQNVSAGGLGLRLCYPFPPGTHLAVEFDLAGTRRTLLARVLPVREQEDGTWFLGCELANRLTDAEADNSR